MSNFLSQFLSKLITSVIGVAFTISGVKNTVKAGEIIIMPANEPHALQAVNSPYKMILTMIKS